jgi:hypothetical protein
MSTAVGNILEQLFGPLAESLSPEAAEQVLQFRIDPAVRFRIADLAEKANEGLLTDDERAEYLSFIETMDLVSILQAKVRDALARHAR